MKDPRTRRELLAGAALTLAAGSAAGAAAQTAPAGTGTDATSLRFSPGWRGGVDRSVADRLHDTVSVLDFIPASEHAAIRERRSTADLARYFAAAIGHINASGGGELYIPAGRYRCASPVTLCNNLHLRGAGKIGSHLQFTHSGTAVPSASGLRLIQPSNTSTQAYVKLSDLFVEMAHGDNRGACFYDNCSTYLTLRDCTFVGGKYGVIFDQTEVAGIYSCNFAAQHTASGAGVWLVNGPDITPGNRGGFTNQITIDHNCQFNEGGNPGAYAILDDGGDCHVIGHNNVNGGGYRFAACANLTIIGGEYEAVNGRPTMTFAAHTLGGAPVGSVHAMIINPLIVQPGGLPCIQAFSMASLCLLWAKLTASAPAAACITGTWNIGSIFARGNYNPNTPLPIFDSYASNHDDGNLPIRTTPATVYTLAITENQALLQTTSGSAVTITVPSNEALGFPVGSRVLIEQHGAGAVSVVGARGVTVHGPGTTSARYQRLELIKTAVNRWLVSRAG